MEGLLRQKQCLTEKKNSSVDFHVPTPLWDKYEKETDNMEALRADLGLWLSEDFCPTPAIKEEMQTIRPRINAYESLHAKVDNFMSAYDEWGEAVHLTGPILATSGAGAGRSSANAATGAGAGR